MSLLTARLLPHRRQRRLLGRLLVCGSVLTSAACGTDVAAPTPESGVSIRIVNGLFQTNGTVSTPIAIDYLLDSTTTAPSVLGLAAGGISAGDGENRYSTFSRGVHTFLARRAGDMNPKASLYTGPSNQPYLPKLFLPAGLYYTIVVTGVIPDTGEILENSIPFTLVGDDPFPGPKNNVGVTQARLRVLNAAPYTSPSGTGADVEIYVTPGTTIPDTITKYTRTGTSFFQFGSQYINVNPGTYVLTLRASGAIVAQQTVTFTEGEIRMFVLQSTAAGPPSIANHKVTDILDRKY